MYRVRQTSKMVENMGMFGTSAVRQFIDPIDGRMKVLVMDPQDLANKPDKET